MDIPKIVEVIATDWAIYNDKYTLPDTFDPMEIHVVGYLLEDTEEYVSLAFERMEETKPKASVRVVISIPKVCVKSIRELVSEFIHAT